MTLYRVWRTDTETAYADIEADDEEAAIEKLQDGDDAVAWTSTRYDADYEAEEVVAVRCLRCKATGERGAVTTAGCSWPSGLHNWQEVQA